MNFIFICHDGRCSLKFYSLPPIPFRLGSSTSNLHFIKLYYQTTLMDFIINWHDGIYRSKVIFSTISTQRLDFEVKVIDLEVFAHYMGLNARKRVFWANTNLRIRTESDQRLCYWLFGKLLQAKISIF